MTIETVLARLSAGLEEDKRIATATSGTSAEREWVYAEGRVSDTGEYGGLHAETHDPRDGVHIARHAPDRVLRQVEAIRKVIADVEPRVPHFDAHIADGDQTFAAYTEGYRDACAMFLSALAGIYPEPTEERS